MALGQILALRPRRALSDAYAVCFVLSLAYSVPPLRLKAVAGADWLINMWGFGTLTPPRDGRRPGVPIDPARGLVLLAFCPLFAALYPLTQIYQVEEDTRRGDRTLACVLGVRRSLSRRARRGRRWRSRSSSRRAFGPDGGCGGAGPLAVGRAAAWRSSCWAAVLLPWRRRWPRLAPADHQRGMYRALGGMGGHRPRRRARLGHVTRPLAARVDGCVYFATLIRLGDGMHSAVELRADHDLTDIPAIVRGAVKLGLLESVFVLLISLVSRLLPNGALQTVLIGVIVLVGLAAVTLLPGLVDPAPHHRGDRRAPRASDSRPRSCSS